MARMRIAGALVAVVLTSCSIEEPEQALRAARPPLAYQAEGTAQTGAAENAGLRTDFKAAC